MSLNGLEIGLRSSRKRKVSAEHSGLTVDLLRDLMAANQISTSTVKKIKLFTDEQVQWIVETDGAVMGEKLAALHDVYSAHADSDSEKNTGTHTYTWNKCISAVVIDCVDHVLDTSADLSTEDQEKELFQTVSAFPKRERMRGSFVFALSFSQTASLPLALATSA